MSVDHHFHNLLLLFSLDEQWWRQQCEIWGDNGWLLIAVILILMVVLVIVTGRIIRDSVTSLVLLIVLNAMVELLPKHFRQFTIRPSLVEMLLALVVIRLAAIASR